LVVFKDLKLGKRLCCSVEEDFSTL